MLIIGSPYGLTREPWDGIRFIHDWMPVILPREAVDEWIAPGSEPEALLGQCLTEMEFETASSQQSIQF